MVCKLISSSPGLALLSILDVVQMISRSPWILLQAPKVLSSLQAKTGKEVFLYLISQMVNLQGDHRQEDASPP